ncbi:alpha/beta hydrolase [Planotetraspora sp. GP83]|uniref:alpha/beta hydrolase n=1 Tax=Planotetraspora sp. GP83 TaxID=3156264 RepID=UPI0035186271
MGLTATKVQLLFVVLAVAGLVATVWVWPRLSSRTWPSVAGRVGVLALNQILILVALALVTNAYFGFYGSWGDLFGTDDSTAPILPLGAGAVVGQPGLVRVIGSRPVLVPKAKEGRSGGRLEQVVISGPQSRLSTPAYVYLPPQYFEKKFATTRFPAIVALTGYPGDARNLITRLNFPGLVAKSILAKQINPTVLVLMRPTIAPPRDTECVDVPGGPQVETFLAKDVPHAMAGAFRVGTDAGSWGVIGGSTGGYCALKLSMRHPDAFSAAVSLSGYFHALTDVTTGDLFGGSRQLRDENDLMWRLAHLPAPPVSVLVTSSKRGESDYRTTEQFLKAVKTPMQAASLILPSGGHNFATWNRELPEALPWLAQQLHAPAQPQTRLTAAQRPRPRSSAASLASSARHRRGSGRRTRPRP